MTYCTVIVHTPCTYCTARVRDRPCDRVWISACESVCRVPPRRSSRTDDDDYDDGHRRRRVSARALPMRATRAFWGRPRRPTIQRAGTPRLYAQVTPARPTTFSNLVTAVATRDRPGPEKQTGVIRHVVPVPVANGDDVVRAGLRRHAR